MQPFEQIFLAETGLKLEAGVPLAAYSSFKIGGPARFLPKSLILITGKGSWNRQAMPVSLLSHRRRL